MSDALLEAAIEQFGEHGLAGASTRAIAAQAGAAMSTITYRYGGKEGLYLAAAAYIANRIGEGMRPGLAPTGGDPVDHVVRIIRHFTGFMVGLEATHWSRFIIREQMQPTEAFGLLWNGVMSEVVGLITERVAEATGETDFRAARVITLTIMGQALIFRAASATVSRALDRPTLEPDDIAVIQDQLEANIRAILKPREP
jgi:AcrR family transcriptional regulator